MTEHQHDREPAESSGHTPDAYERTDAHLRGIALAGAALVLATVVILAICVAIFNYYTARTGGNQGEIPPLPLAERGKLPPAPRLEGLEKVTEAESSPETDTPPHDYGWVDEEKRMVRIPIARAMQLALKRLHGAAPPAESGADAEVSAERAQPPSAASSGRIVLPSSH